MREGGQGWIFFLSLNIPAASPVSVYLLVFINMWRGGWEGCEGCVTLIEMNWYTHTYCCRLWLPWWDLTEKYHSYSNNFSDHTARSTIWILIQKRPSSIWAGWHLIILGRVLLVLPGELTGRNGPSDKLINAPFLVITVRNKAGKARVAIRNVLET